MAEVFETFTDVLVGENGVVYRAHACGAEMADGTWQGWVEFIPRGGGDAIRSGRETTQPNRTDLKYWATGLTPVYLEGALQRALKPVVRRTVAPETPRFDGPAPAVRDEGPRGPEREAVLDPFSVYSKGEGLLRGQLAAMSRHHLLNIIEKYGLSQEPPATLNARPAQVLIETIIAGVSAHA